MKGKNAAPGQEAAPSTNNQPHGTYGVRLRGSRQIAWWTVHQWIAPFLERVASWPMAGTPEWVALADDDPAKLAAVLDGGRFWALRLDTCQEEMAEASQAISECADWKQVASRIQQRTEYQQRNPWAKRVAS